MTAVVSNSSVVWHLLVDKCSELRRIRIFDFGLHVPNIGPVK